MVTVVTSWLRLVNAGRKQEAVVSAVKTDHPSTMTSSPLILMNKRDHSYRPQGGAVTINRCHFEVANHSVPLWHEWLFFTLVATPRRLTLWHRCAGMSALHHAGNSCSGSLERWGRAWTLGDHVVVLPVCTSAGVVEMWDRKPRQTWWSASEPSQLPVTPLITFYVLCNQNFLSDCWTFIREQQEF